MKTKSLVICALVFCAAPTFAAQFLKVENVQGESKDSAHAGWFQLLSWTWGPVQGQSPDAMPKDAATKVCRTHEVKLRPAVDLNGHSKLIDMCRTRTPLSPTVVVDIDGVRHTLQNPRFRSCTDGANNAMVLDYDRCLTHPSR